MHSQVDMVSKSGKKFSCVIPDFVAGKSISVPEDNKPKPQLTNYTASIEAAFKNACVMRTIDYWSYEVCPFKSVKQLRL